MTPLISEVWQHELATHPDQSFVSYVVNRIKRGFRVGYDHTRTRTREQYGLGPRAPRCCFGLPTAGGVAELHSGHSSHISSIYSLPHKSLIPKKAKPGKWRLIAARFTVVVLCVCVCVCVQAAHLRLTQLSLGSANNATCILHRGFRTSSLTLGAHAQ